MHLPYLSTDMNYLLTFVAEQISHNKKAYLNLSEHMAGHEGMD